MPDVFHAASTQYYRRCEIALIKRCFGPLQGKRVLKLDLWNEAVNTRILHWMASEAAYALGLDLSQVVVSRARRDAVEPNGLHLIQGDIRHLLFASNSFDFVYTMGTIEHIDEPQDAVGEVQRVLRPGGKAIIGVPHKWNVFLRPVFVKALEFFDRYPYSPERSFGWGPFRRMVERGGLRVHRRRGILCVPGVIRMADLFFFQRGLPLDRLVAWVIRPFEYLETRWEWPGYLGYLIVVEAEKPASS